MEQFTRSRRSLREGDSSAIEFTFGGLHHWAHGPEMRRYIETVLARETADAIVINVDDYTYEYGNDLFVLFVTGFDKVTKRLRPVCIVAHGQTEASLKTLFAASNTSGIFDVSFLSTRRQLGEWLQRKACERSAC